MAIAPSRLSNRLDLTRLQSIRPALILDLDFEAILAARLATLQARFNEAAEETATDPIDVLTLETEPTVILQQEDAYRQLLDYGLLNDKVRGLLVAFATGTDLDHLVARAGIQRITIRAATDSTPAIMEDDDTLRIRYWAGFGAPAAGSEDAYILAALSAFPTAWHVYCLGPTEHGDPGRVDVVVTARDGEAVDDDTLVDVERACSAKSVRPLTDMVNVVGATPAPYQVEMTVEIVRGPDPQAVKADVEARIAAIVGSRYRGGGEVPRAALAAAGYEAGAVSVTVAKPVADIPRQVYVAPWCSLVTVTVVERLND